MNDRILLVFRKWLNGFLKPYSVKSRTRKHICAPSARPKNFFGRPWMLQHSMEGHASFLQAITRCLILSSRLNAQSVWRVPLDRRPQSVA